VWCGVAGKSILHLKDHKAFVQGVAWDPRGQFLASQSCDRCASMETHV
jgi:hypothetical protein